MEALVAVGVELLGRADLLVLHNAIGLEEAVARVLVAGLVLGSGEHDLAVVRRREFPACGDKYSCQLKPQDDTVARNGKRTNIDFVALERVPVDLFLVEFNQRPVAGELVGSVADGDGFDVEEKTRAPVPSYCGVFNGAMERPSVGVKGLRSSGTGSRRGLKGNNLGPGATDCVTSDSRKATWISGKPA